MGEDDDVVEFARLLHLFHNVLPLDLVIPVLKVALRNSEVRPSIQYSLDAEGGDRDATLFADAVLHWANYCQ